MGEPKEDRPVLEEKETKKKKKNGDGPKDAAKQLANLYLRWVLDPLIEVAHAVAKDRRNSYERYTNPLLDDDAYGLLVKLEQQVGSVWPERPDRLKGYTGPFGTPPVPAQEDTTSQFFRLTSALREAASRFMNPKMEDNTEGLRLAFAQEVRKTREYLLPRIAGGKPVERLFHETCDVFDAAVDILTSDSVAGAFGKSAPKGEWVQEGANGEAAALVSEITKVLQPDSIGPIQADDFMTFQDIAHHGAATLEMVLTVDLGSDLNNLRQRTYMWKTAIDSLSSPA